MASLRQILLLVASCSCLSVLAKRESEESSAAAAAAVEQTVREHSAAQAEAAASTESYAGIGVFASGQLEVARTVNAALKRKFFGGSPTPAPQPPPDDVGGDDQQSTGNAQQTPPTNQNQNTEQQPQSRQTAPSTNGDGNRPTEVGATPAPAGPPPPSCNLQSEPATCDGVKSQRKGWWGRTFSKSNEQQRLIEKTNKLCKEHASYRKDAVKAEKDMKEYSQKLETATKLFNSLKEDLIDNEANIAKQGQTLEEIIAAANKHGVLMQKMQQMQKMNSPAEHKENTDPQDHQ